MRERRGPTEARRKWQCGEREEEAGCDRFRAGIDIGISIMIAGEDDGQGEWMRGGRRQWHRRGFGLVKAVASEGLRMGEGGGLTAVAKAKAEVKATSASEGRDRGFVCREEKKKRERKRQNLRERENDRQNG